MYQTMHRQPADLRRLLETGWEPARQAAELLAPASRVFVVGVGTSYHAALVGEWLLRAAGMDARAVLSFDFAAYPRQYPLGQGDAVIVMAHSGVKTFTMQALERAAAEGATALAAGADSASGAGAGAAAGGAAAAGTAGEALASGCPGSVAEGASATSSRRRL
jgi:glucosamine--fructose-6-phosphate aminotransferase (isomerizing)